MPDPDHPQSQDRTEAGADPLAGQSVGAYRIEQALGGDLGWAAVQPLLGRKVAIRPLAPALARDPSRLERLKRDLQALSAIKHRGIGEVFGLEALPDGRACLVTEWVTGESVETVMDREDPLTVSGALQVFDELLSALAVAHRLGVLHLELKPGNLFLARSTSGQIALKVFGFGQAAVSNEERSPQTDLSAAGRVLLELSARVGALPQSLDTLITALRGGQISSAEAGRLAIAQILRELKEQATRTVAVPAPSASSEVVGAREVAGLVAASDRVGRVAQDPLSATVVAPRRSSLVLGRGMLLMLFVGTASGGAWWWVARSSAPSAEPELTVPLRASPPAVVVRAAEALEQPPAEPTSPTPAIPALSAPAAPPRPGRPRAAQVVEPARRWLRLGSGCQADPVWRTEAMEALRDLSTAASANAARWAEYQRREPALTKAIQTADDAVACGHTSRQLGELIDGVLRP